MRPLPRIASTPASWMLRIETLIFELLPIPCCRCRQRSGWVPITSAFHPSNLWLRRPSHAASRFQRAQDAGAAAAALLRIAREADGDEQGDAVEQRLDEERAADLLNAGDADGEDGDADDRAPDVDAARLDRGRAEEGADQGRQQVFQADAGLADPQAGRQQQAGEGAERARHHEGADDEAAASGCR